MQKQKCALISGTQSCYIQHTLRIEKFFRKQTKSSTNKNQNFRNFRKSKISSLNKSFKIQGSHNVELCFICRRLNHDMQAYNFLFMSINQN